MLNIITLKYWTLNILLDADTVSESEFLSDSDSVFLSDTDSEFLSDSDSEYEYESDYESDTTDFKRQIFSTYHHYQCEYGTRYKSCDCGCRDKP